MDMFQEYKRSLYSAWGYNDYNDWPIKFNSIMHLFVKEFAEEFYSELKIAMEEFQRKEIALKFNNPARIYRIIHSVVYGLRLSGLTLDEQRDAVRMMLEMNSDLKSGDIFNRDGRNIIYDDISRFSNYVYTVCDKIQASMLQRFFGLMWAYTESLFFRAHDVTKEIHGLYTDGEYKVLIREYYNLRPKDIWGDLPYTDYSSFKIITYYTKDLSISLDAYKHIFFKGGNYIENMVKYRIEADGKVISLDELLNQIPKMEATIKATHEWSDNSDSKAIINRYADIYWYRKKALKDILGLDWRVPEHVRKNIEEGDVDQRRLKKLSDRQIEFMINTLI